MKNKYIIFLVILAAFVGAYLVVEKNPAVEEITTKIEHKVADKINPPPPPDKTFNPSVPDTVKTDSVLLNVPFTSQAPTGNWSDPRQQDGCEEASIYMAWLWVNGKTTTSAEAEKAITDMSDYETANYGNYYDLDAQDTAKLFTDYYGFTNMEVKLNPTIEDIKNALKQGKLVLAPANGQKLGNPHYTAPGPYTHFLVIKGFNDAKSQFITNDSGTQYGKSYAFNYQTLYNALVNYPSGHHESQEGRPKAMIVVTK